MMTPKPNPLAFVVASTLLVAGAAHGQISGGSLSGTATGRGIASPGNQDSPVVLWLSDASSSNLARVPNGDGGNYSGLGAGFNVDHKSERLRAGVNGNLEFQKYPNDVLESNGRVGAVGAFANVGIVPDRFVWKFQDSYSQGRTDAFRADTPFNRENINVVSTGPRVNLRVGDRTALNIDGAFSRRKYSESDFLDSDVRSYDVSLNRQVRPTTSVGLAARSSDFDYSAVGIGGYTIDSLQANNQKQLANGNTNLTVGKNWLRNSTTDNSDLSFQFNWTRSLSARSTLDISANSGFTDTGGLIALGPDSIGTVPNVVVGSDILLSRDATNRKEVEVVYSLNLSRTIVSVRVAGVRDAFERDTILNSDSRTFEVGISRQLTDAMTVGIGTASQRRAFETAGTDTETYTGLWFKRRLARRFEIEIDAQKNSRTGFLAFEEKVYQLRVVYSAGGRTR